ncbi:NAD(P)-dependent dehydrogenase, short-chain alcohol dehydrogenase family [Cyclonatronum proteinivorum]|uniref:NAD(P)-dependent dehydrogenase, short-chain alcohol dehydrogenase family n=1 Tax=Cyclonatronum proteinivorum TaxID=1457365 RepID=A0A345UKW9_9BACT|nr:SDR family oxidoreductase [Cyclonatronum proteinivorum]AXJ01121.1 NAD(P)-dependent dehydrogenase, short-chain alcohol dehydrogenase family [Cyclonatronum proteinivorum]
MSNSQKTVLITGGSSGIGAETVRLFYEDGFRVIFTYRSGKKAALSLMQKLCGNAEGDERLTAYAWDAAQRESLEALCDSLDGKIPDILINNAAVGSATVKKLSDDPYEQDYYMMVVNAVSPLWMIRKFLPEMKIKGGKIVNISSVGGGITQFPNFTTADGMSKAAVAFMTRQLAAELSHHPVDVFAVCPGAVETPMFGASTLDHLDEQKREKLIRQLPAERLIQSEEVARLIRYLCRPEAEIMRGAVIDASLGLGSNPGLLSNFS